jgi:hypothetical protein
MWHADLSLTMSIIQCLSFNTIALGRHKSDNRKIQLITVFCILFLDEARNI